MIFGQTRVSQPYFSLPVCFQYIIILVKVLFSQSFSRSLSAEHNTVESDGKADHNLFFSFLFFFFGLV
jgi:hypothetical protein